MKRLLVILPLLVLATAVMAQNSGIAGVVTDASTGRPILHAKVSTHCFSAFTDSSGCYIIRNLRPGRYVVVAGAQGYEMQVYPDTVVVAPGQTVEGIDFALKPQGGGQCGAIAGEVTDAKTGAIIRGAVVVARGNGIVREVTQCCHGYKIGNLPAGKYFVGAAAPGYEPGSYPDSVVVVAGQVTEHIDFALEPQGGGQTGGISGLVTDEGTGKPVFGACVLAVGPVTGRANTNMEGIYAIRNLPAGTYAVVAKARGYEPSAPQTVEVVAGQMTEDVDFALKPCIPAVPGAIAGVVTDKETGDPVVMAVVFTWGPHGQGHAMTDSFGEYVMRVRPGRYLVRACARGYYPALYPDTVLVVEKETVFGIDFALEPAGLRAGGIAGFVYDGEAQTELRNARVTAIGPNGSFETTSNEHGEYLFDNLEPGDYRVTVTASGYTEEVYPELVVVEASDIVSFTSPAVYPLTGVEEAPAKDPAVAGRLVAEPSLVITSGRISWQVPVAGHVTVKVLDNSGRVVRTIQDGYQNSGRYSAVWDRSNDRGEQIANGVYFYRLDAPTCQDVQKVVVASR